MENIKNINLKDIKENIYTLKNLSQQILINNIYYNVSFYGLFECFKEKLLTKYSYNFINNINLNNYICYKKYRSDEDIISNIFDIINFYIFCYDNEKENLYLEILNNNLIYISNKKIHEENFYFKKEIFEDLFLKLNLKCKIIIKHLNTKDKIINYYLDKDKRIKYYTLNNGDIIYKNLNTQYNDSVYHYKNKINYSFKEDYGDNNQISSSNDYYIFKYTETLIINCNNNSLNIKEENDKLNENINYKEEIIKLKEEIKELKIKNNKLTIENNELKEYKDKFNKLKLILK